MNPIPDFIGPVISATFVVLSLYIAINSFVVTKEVFAEFRRNHDNDIEEIKGRLKDIERLLRK